MNKDKTTKINNSASEWEAAYEIQRSFQKQLIKAYEMRVGFIWHHLVVLSGMTHWKFDVGLVFCSFFFPTKTSILMCIVIWFVLINQSQKTLLIWKKNY